MTEGGATKAAPLKVELLRLLLRLPDCAIFRYNMPFGTRVCLDPEPKQTEVWQKQHVATCYMLNQENTVQYNPI